MFTNKSTKDNANNDLTATVDYDPHIEAYVVDTKEKEKFENDDTQGNVENCNFKN